MTKQPTPARSASSGDRYTRNLDGIDIAVTGIPFDLATTNRPGARLGPRAVRTASAQLSWGPPWPWGFDPTRRLAIVDIGDCALDHGRPAEIPATIEQHATDILNAGASMLSIGGDHYITLPLLRAHASRHGPLALVHFDAHSDTWSDEDGRIDHGTMFYHAVREGIVDVARSVQIGIRTHNDDRLGFTWLDAAWVPRAGAGCGCKGNAPDRRRRQGLPDVRHRLPRPPPAHRARELR